VSEEVATLLDDSSRGSCWEAEHAVSDKPVVGVRRKALFDRSWSKVNLSDTWCSKATVILDTSALVGSCLQETRRIDDIG
jgi:hypothetical protein